MVASLAVSGAMRNWVPNLCKSKSLEVLRICRGEVANAMVSKGEGESGVNDLAESGGGPAGPVPERLGDCRFVVAKFPGGMSAERVAEGGRFAGRFGLLEYSRVSELHVNFHQHRTTKKETLISASLLLKETLGSLMMRFIHRSENDVKASATVSQLHSG